MRSHKPTVVGVFVIIVCLASRFDICLYSFLLHMFSSVSLLLACLQLLIHSHLSLDYCIYVCACQ